jgi:predicted RNA-binding Zn-ribbon protein involved in translation (DUF1610 family)
MKVKAIGIGYECDKCTYGTMEFTGATFLTNPPKYGHKCDNCGEKMMLKDKYPTTKWERVYDLD